MGALTSTGEDLLVISDEPSPRRTVRKRRRIVRWLALTAVLGPIAALMTVPFVAAVRARRVVQCSQQLARLGVALQLYHDAHGHFPAPTIARDDGTPLLSWRVAILPSLGYQSLYNRFRLDEPWDSTHNLALLSEMPDEFACPSGPALRRGQTTYLVVVGPKTDFGSVNTPFEPTRGAEIREFTDGTSNPVLVFETDTHVPWTKPDDLHWAPGGPQPKLASAHRGGTQVLFADGSTRFLKPTIRPDILVGLLTMNGNEVLSSS
jgi:prepilin-type processing-associated H-X9-DG protein